MKKIFFFKLIFMFIILLAAVSGFHVDAEDSTTKWSLEFGSHYSGFEGYSRKVAEFDRGKEGFTPELSLNLFHVKQKNSFKFTGKYYDPKRMSFSLEGKSRDLIDAKISYSSFYRQLQKDLLSNLEAREAGDREGTTFGGKIFTHEDMNSDKEYGYRRQEINTDIDFKVPGTNKLKLMVTHRSIYENGTDQHIQLNHCATCHAVSRSLDFKQKTHSISAGAELDLEPVSITYKASYRSFKSDAGPYEALYDVSRHPVNGGAGEEFSSRLNYSGESVPIGLYPETGKLAHNLKIKANMGKSLVLAQYTNYKAKNKTSNLNYNGNQANLKVIYPVSKRTKLVGTGSYGSYKNDSIFIDQPSWREGIVDNGANLDWTRYSNLTRTEGNGSLNYIFQPSRRFRFSLLGKFSSINRDDYPFQGANDKTTKIRLQTEFKYRPTMKFSGRLKYYIEHIENPFAPYNLMFEHIGSSGPHQLVPEPGMTQVFYYQRDALRYGDITTLPTLVNGIYFDLKLRPSKKFNIVTGINVRYGTNSDEPELNLKQTTLQPKLSFNWMPGDKIIFSGSYSYLVQNQNGLAVVAMMDG